MVRGDVSGAIILGAAISVVLIAVAWLWTNFGLEVTSTGTDTKEQPEADLNVVTSAVMAHGFAQWASAKGLNGEQAEIAWVYWANIEDCSLPEMIDTLNEIAEEARNG